MTPTSILDALAQHDRLTTSLVQLYRERAQLNIQEHQARINAWVHDQSTSVSARDRVADYHSLQFSSDRMDREGEIRAYEAELQSIEIWLKYQGE